MPAVVSRRKLFHFAFAGGLFACAAPSLSRGEEESRIVEAAAPVEANEPASLDPAELPPRLLPLNKPDDALTPAGPAAAPAAAPVQRAPQKSVVKPPPRPKAATKPLRTPPLPGNLPPEPVALPGIRPSLEPPTLTPLHVEVAKFSGIQPGKSDRDAVIEALGKPREVVGHNKATYFVYANENFSRIEIEILKDLVQSITVHLEEPLEPQRLAEKLELDGVRSAEVTDEEGRPLGRAFPERGVLFSYAAVPGDPVVGQVLIEGIDVQSFILRVEGKVHGPFELNLADLDYALRLDPKHARALWLRARILATVGRAEEALYSADEACRLKPQEPAYQLTRAESLIELGRYQEASKSIEAVLAATPEPSALRAQALLRAADLFAQGPQRNYGESVKVYQEAISLAERVARSPKSSERRAAKETLVLANLGVARSISLGNWKRKEEAVPKWLVRAEDFAEDYLASDEGPADLRLHLIEQSLAIRAGFKPPVDPTVIVQEAKSLADDLVAQSEDSYWKKRIGWMLGLTYSHAVQVEHVRGRFDEGAKYGELAKGYFEEGAADRQTSQRARCDVGLLYFYVGALHAVHRSDHETAVEWYSKATPLLAPLAGGTPADPVQLGESLVSMGVSFWEAGLKQKAIELTASGAKLVELAVQQGIAGRAALAVPYGNLASMHQELGNREESRDFSQMAEKSLGTMRR